MNASHHRPGPGERRREHNPYPGSILHSILQIITVLLLADGTRFTVCAFDAAADGLPRIFAPADGDAVTSTASTPWQPRPTRIQRRLDPGLFATRPSAWNPGQRLRLDLLDRQDITFEVESVESTAEGATVLHGRSATQEDSSGTLSWEGQELTGLLHLPGLGRFQILPLAEPGVHEVRRLDARHSGFCGTDLLTEPAIARSRRVAPSALGPEPAGLPAADTQPEPTVIDVLFLYTPQTIIGEGSEEGIHKRILESVDDTNRRFQMSLINVVINPVHIARVNYPETGNMEADVQQLAAGQVPGATGLRADYKADLVVMVTELENAGIGGIAIDLPPTGGNPNTAFTVLGRTQIGGQIMVLAHELGHLFGCAHDREHAGDVNSNYYTSRKPYIFGHRLVVEGVTYVSLMGYDPGIQLPQFSNPNLSLDGVPLGVASGGVRPADGARTVNEMAPYVARYRQALSRISFTAKRTTVAEDAGSVTLGLVRTGDLNTSTRVTVVAETSSAAKPGLDFTWTPGATVEFATNQATAELVIPLLADEVAEGAESLRLRLTGLLGFHGVGTQGTTEVVILDAGTSGSVTAVQFPDGPVAVPESAGLARVKVDCTGCFGVPPAEPVTLSWRAEDDTAVAGQDYQASSGTLTFTPEVPAQEVTVPIQPRPEAGRDRSLRLVVGARTNVIRIVDEQRPGSLVSTPGPGFPEPSDTATFNAAVRNDGKLLVWGSFARMGEADRTGLALLNADGSVDTTFRPPEFLLGHRPIERVGRDHPNAILGTVLVLPDNRMLVAGRFSRVGGNPRVSLVRLQADGSLDETFGPDLTFDAPIAALARQADGKILIAGQFERINKIRRPFIWRLNEDGTVDSTFKPRGGPTSSWTVWISAVAVQPDGRILMGGNFDTVDGKPAINLARLNSDGTLDTSFKLPSTGVAGPVGLITLQPDGRIVLAGLFDSVGGRSNTRKLARLHASGAVDTSFKSPNPNAEVYAVAALPDGRFLVSGIFTTIGGKERRFIARLAADGGVDPTFDLGTGPDGLPGGSLSIHADGTLYLAGTFRRINGIPAANFARIRFGPVGPMFGMTGKDGSGQPRSVVHGLPGGVYVIESGDGVGPWESAGEVRLQGYDRTAEFAVPVTEADRRLFRVRNP